MSAAAPVLPFDEANKPIGHNQPPADFALTRADFEQRVAEFLKGLDVWATRPELDAATAPRALDFQKGLKKLAKEADEARAAEKKPHDDAAKAVQTWWKGLDSRIQKAVDAITPKLAAYQRRQDEKRRAAEAEARAAREAEQRKADEARKAAAHAATESQRIAAEAAAEAAEQAAAERAREEKAQAGPARIESATGLANRTGTRKVWSCDVTDLTRAMLDLRKRHEGEFLELVKRLAGAELRAAPVVSGEKQVPQIPGVSFRSEEKFS